MSTDSIDDLIRDLSDAAAKSGKHIRAAVEHTARTAKDVWRETAKGPSGKHAKRYPASIDYDMVSGVSLARVALGSGADANSISAEVGPTPGKGQGALGILEDAPGGVKSKPQNARRVAARAAEEDLDVGLEKALDDALEELGL